MGDLLSDATEFQCPFCPSPLKMSVPSSLATGNSKTLANTANFSFPPPGGMCAITQSPCTPAASVIDPGQMPVYIDGKLALGADCKFVCSKGGIIQNPSSGQGVGQHTSTSAEKSEEPSPKEVSAVKCSHVRKKILAGARAVSSTDTEYSQKQGKRMGPDSYDCSGLIAKIFNDIGQSCFMVGKAKDNPNNVDGIMYFARNNNDKFSISKLYKKGGDLPKETDWKEGDLIVFLKSDNNSYNHIGVLSEIKNPPEESKVISALNHHPARKGKAAVPSVREAPIRVLPSPGSGNSHAFYVVRFVDCVPD